MGNPKVGEDFSPEGVRAMRQRITDFAYGPTRMDGRDSGVLSRISPASSMTHRILRLCQGHGLSGEDAMTVLAFHALKLSEQQSDFMLNDIMTRPFQPDVIKTAIRQPPFPSY